MCVCQWVVPKVMFFTGVCQSVGGQQVRSNCAALAEIRNKMCLLYRYKETAQFQNDEAIFQSCSFS